MFDELVAEIKLLESQSLTLDPDEQIRSEWKTQVYSFAETFLKNLTLSKAYQQSDADTQIASISEHPQPIEDVLATCHRLNQSGIDTASGRYLGFVPGGGLYPAALADYLAALTNRFTGIYFAAPDAVKLENKLIRWLADLLKFPASASGNLTSGGSMANLIAIVTAREAFALRAAEYQHAVMYLTENTHLSAQKALRVAGLGEVTQRYISVDETLAMSISELEQCICADREKGLKPWLLYATAGTTDTGSIDDLEAMAQLAKQYGLWLHVDAAYGGFFLLTEKGKALLKGIHHADSVTLDPHKGLFLPYGSGAVIIRDYQLQKNAFTERAFYLQDCVNLTEELSPCDLSPELTRPFRALRMWLPLQLSGIQVFRAALQEKLLLANYFYQHICSIPRIQFACIPQLSIVTFRYVPEEGDANAFNTQWLEAINQDGRVYLSSTTLNGNFYLRMACLSFRTHLREMELAVEVVGGCLNVKINE